MPAITELEAAQALGVTQRTLADMRRRGEGPPYFQVGKLVRYRPETIERWISDQERRSAQRPATVIPTQRKAVRRIDRSGGRPSKHGRRSASEQSAGPA